MYDGSWAHWESNPKNKVISKDNFKTLIYAGTKFTRIFNLKST
jgi:hypothetical protein